MASTTRGAGISALQRIPVAAGGESPLVHGLDVEQWFSCYSLAMHQSLQSLFVFLLPQGQGSGAASTAAAIELPLRHTITLEPDLVAWRLGEVPPASAVHCS